MYALDDLIDDETVRAGASLFPVEATLNSAGMSPTRFVLAQIPDSDPAEWVACVWRQASLGEPELILCEQVDQVVTFSAQRVQLLLTNGNQLVITPAGGCGCGNRLKTWSPFGSARRLAHVPVPRGA